MITFLKSSSYYSVAKFLMVKKDALILCSPERCSGGLDLTTANLPAEFFIAPILAIIASLRKTECSQY